MAFSDLTPTEQCYYQAYARLRELSDWEGFDDRQEQTKQDARAWLVNQRQFIWRCAEGKETPEYKAGWGINNRQARYNTLKDNALNTAASHNNCQLPTNGGTPSEKAMISEREGWWNWSSVDDQTKAWRQKNVDVLTDRRRQVWHLGEDEGWDEAERQHRYDNLCVATKTGEAYEQWSASHNDTTGQENGSSDGDSSSRAKAVSNCRKYLGVSENPPDSNRGSPQPDGWQKRVYGSSGVPWCSCFSTCMAWDSGVKGSGSAGVSQMVSMAQNGTGMMRGWTTDPSKVLRGDMAVIGCTTCHIGMVVDSDDACHTIEGNTSPGSEGSQYNGGCVAERHRGRSEIVGWCLVDYP